MPYEPFDKQTLTSSSHLTVSQNIELRTLLNECNRMAISRNLDGWKLNLDAVERELYYDLNRHDKEITEEKKATKYSERIKAVESQIEEVAAFVPKNKADEIRKSKLAYKLLSKKEIILRDLQEWAGKGTKRTYSEDDDDE